MRALGTVALALATFMNVLDTSIANVSIPAMSGDLGVSSDQGTWVITSFGVANAISLPLTGWLTQRYGQVRLFTASVLLFVIASILCALAPSLGLLIVFRVIQGAVAGPMIPLSQTLLLASYPKEKAGSALAIWAMTTLVAPVVGPVLGGWITDNYSWPWIFYINVPVGLGAAAVTWMIYRKRESPIVRLPIDGVGLALLVVWVGALQIMLDQGKDLDWFASTQIVLLAIAAVVGFTLFVVWELTERYPVVDLRLFARRNFLVSTVTVSLAYGTFFGSVVLLPLWLQEYMGYTATDAGMVLAPVGLLAILLTPVVGRTVDKVDPRLFVTGAFATFGLVMYMRSRFATSADFTTLAIPTLVQGAAMAMFFLPLITLALSGLPPERIASASGLFNFARLLAGSFGTSIATTFWDRRATLHHAQLVEHITRFDAQAQQALSLLQANGMSVAQSLAVVDRLVTQQAFMLSANDMFHASALLFLALIGVAWLARPAARTQGARSAAIAAE
ncbi:DHA2 family efflux MFS transporter permease subunit [Ramlibacter sp.]|uniref:DHA2 family efflux MFS transporter permease subunit n=1 Tax=Ramlibacter sp. TaxID=1917967 RepID=UPI002616F79B|nr:DHA2 family efflux MFS transporter permease subunit [Ramlibacter sp.]